MSLKVLSDSNASPDGDKLLNEVKSWNELRVADWLQTVDSASYASIFVSNHINGDALLECDQTALKQLGIAKVGDRVRLLVAIKALRNKCFGTVRPQSIAAALALDLAPLSPTVSLHSHSSSMTLKTPTTLHPNRGASLCLSPTKTKNAKGDSVESPVRSASGMSSLLQNCVKFIGEEGQTRIVNIGECTTATMILEKALKKFGLSESITMDPSDRAENYCAFVTADVGPARQLDIDELLQICQDPNRPERERLILKKRDSAPSILEHRQATKILKEQQALLKDQAMVNNMGKLKKIGGFFGEMPHHIRSASTSTAPTTPSAISPSSQNPPRGPKARIKEFFGGRPPSELISSNLQDYFPEASTLILEKTVRNSIRRSQRMSVAARGSAKRRPSNASVLSVASYKSLMPPIPSVGDAWISATMLPRKSRPGSLHRSPSTISKADTIRSKRSIKSPTSEGEATGTKYEPSVKSALSCRTVSTEGPDSQFSEDMYRDGDSFSSSSAVSEAEGDEYEGAISELEDGYDLPDYLKEKLALTADEDETNSTLRAQSIALASGEAVDLRNSSVDSADAENTGPFSWIKGALIGQGSFGSVVLGMNALTGELMAVKQVDLPKNTSGDVTVRKTSMLDALQREIALLRDLQHDNIVQYLGSNSDDTHLNIFLEYVPGGSVTEMLTKYGAFKEPLVRQFVRQVLTGLNYLHERDIIHRDIKGGNILVDNKGVIKISDFGISKKVEPKLLSMQESVLKASHRPSLQGSVFWMAPEVVRQTQYTRKADIWSLGCLIVEMFTGQHPYPEFDQMQAIFKIGGADSAPDIPLDISADGKDFLQKTFELDFNARPSAADLLVHTFCHASVA